MTSLLRKVSIKKAVSSPAVLSVVQGCVPVTQIPVNIASLTDFNHLKRVKESDRKRLKLIDKIFIER